MISAEAALLEVRQLERLAGCDSPVHRIDPRAKILATLVFIVCVVSMGRYELAALLPCFIFPVVMIASGGLPVRSLCFKILLVIPFALVVGIFNPLIDREILATVGSLQVSAGWFSFASIVLRSALTVASALILVSLTGFPALCRGLLQLGMPKLFVAQLLFLYRYLFVLAEEAARLKLARDQRCFGGQGAGIASFGPMMGHLLLRSWERAERIYRAMLSRGFEGEFPHSGAGQFRTKDALFLMGWSLLLISIRLFDPAHFLGALFTGALR